ncbi:MAG: FxsA family protein, partial [Atribacteria sp.]|nr:FxsA family protein [Candidatus Atribacteria bacterium]
ELYILIEVGKKIGSLTTIGVIILTGIIGAYLVKSQGFMILRKIQNDLNEGIMPGDSLIQGAIILAGGILLLTPGFVTDILGFIFLMPVSRNIVKKYLLKWLKGKIKEGNFYYREF